MWSSTEMTVNRRVRALGFRQERHRARCRLAADGEPEIALQFFEIGHSSPRVRGAASVEHVPRLVPSSCRTAPFQYTSAARSSSDAFIGPRTAGATVVNSRPDTSTS